ncbi:MAG: YggS family pyridoxal phosphate-dependent enzyme [Candidatus Eremiobacteraeota bacterium]|uniref:Putative enzyme n=1 Tax=mine drainage metagenome TaxID=410659 RepID=E6PCK5_9ZZZZ|nr:YggS family pyridoxal phosphate-dependent enzyme [Candidatus Eremiobacteraeota bacterium]
MFAERLAAFHGELERELAACGRSPESVTILGVSKKQPLAAIREAYAAGLRSFGENYLQEAAEKFAPLREEGLAFALHFIGHLQSNKAAKIAALADCVQSVDREEAASALERGAERAERLLPVLLQLNISPSERFGCLPAEAPRLAERLHACSHLRLDGVMAVAPITTDRSEISAAFELAAKTLPLVGGTTLSIGMSGDWREAVRAGSTMLRIGSALFGARPSA